MAPQKEFLRAAALRLACAHLRLCRVVALGIPREGNGVTAVPARCFVKSGRVLYVEVLAKYSAACCALDRLNASIFPVWQPPGQGSGVKCAAKVSRVRTTEELCAVSRLAERIGYAAGRDKRWVGGQAKWAVLELKPEVWEYLHYTQQTATQRWDEKYDITAHMLDMAVPKDVTSPITRESLAGMFANEWDARNFREWPLSPANVTPLPAGENTNTALGALTDEEANEYARTIALTSPYISTASWKSTELRDVCITTTFKALTSEADGAVFILVSRDESNHMQSFESCHTLQPVHVVLFNTDVCERGQVYLSIDASVEVVRVSDLQKKETVAMCLSAISLATNLQETTLRESYMQSQRSFAVLRCLRTALVDLESGEEKQVTII